MMKGGFILKIEKITDDKIKITVTMEDLNERNIDLYSFVYNSPESQDMFWDMLSKAEKECGFNVEDSIIYVEARTSGNGKFTFIVTKTKEKPVVKLNNIQKQQIAETVKLKRKKIPYFIKDGLYKFDNFDDLCSYCKIADKKSTIDTKLYSYKNSYYLKAGMTPATAILEYAEIEKEPLLKEALIKEHGNIIIETDVISEINKFFNKQKRKR